MLIGIESVSAIGCSSAHNHAQVYPPQPTGGESLSVVTAPTTWHKVDAGAFSLFAPLGWELHHLAGVDSYVGEFVGDGVVLIVDFGQDSSGYLKRPKKTADVIPHKSLAGVAEHETCPETP